MTEPTQPPERSTPSAQLSPQEPKLARAPWQTQLIAMLIVASGMDGIQHEQMHAAEKATKLQDVEKNKGTPT